VFGNFLAYKALVEKQSRHQIQTLRKNNRGKYVKKKITIYYIAWGIQMQKIVPYAPQKNGVAEIKNHTLKKWLIV
jgi:hypothetical protein